MNLKFIIIWSFIIMVGTAGISQNNDKYGTRKAGGVNSGWMKSVAGVPKDNIKGWDTDPLPGNYGHVNAQHVGDGVVRVEWTPATDLETESSQLQYLVCATIWPIFDLEELESGYRTGDYEEDISYKYVKLTMGDKWYIDVIVKDGADNVVRYHYGVEMNVDDNMAPVTWKNPDHATLGYFWALDSYDSHPHEIQVLFRSATDDSTPVDSLEYLIYYSLENNISNLEDIERNGTPVGNFRKWTGFYWAEDDQTYIFHDWVTGLEANTKYYFNCVVRDSDGGLMYHGTSWNTTDVDDPPGPGGQGEMLTTVVSPVQINLKWGLGMDDYTEQADLEYLVYYSKSGSISTVDSCLTNGTPFGSFAANIDSAQVTGLQASTNYYFNVVIKDGYGNMSSYNMINDTTELDDPPIPGGSGEISTAVAGTTKINLSWSYGNDDKTAQADLEYLVYYSSSDNISTVGLCETNGTPFGTFSANINSGQVTGLTPNTDYFFNVVIRDAALNKSAYNMVNDTTDIDYPPTPGGSGEILTTVAGFTQINLSWTYATDDFSAQAELEYLVYYSKSDNISTVTECESNGTAFGTFASNINSREVTGLTISTNYYFNVVVKDVMGYKNTYNSVNDTTDIDYPPTPGGSGVISSTFTGTSQVNLSWDYAADDFSPQANLKYLVYYSPTDNLSTVSECENNGTPVGSFATNINSKSVNGLASGTTWYFNVVVKDIPGYKSVYQMTGFTTLVTDDPPVAGNSGTIEVGTVTTSEVTLSWTKATDNASLQANLQYLVYYSTNDNLGTVADCENNGTAFGTYAKDISAQTVTSLAQDTKYYFNIVVKDEGNNKACYQTSNATTDKNSVLAIGSLHEGGIVIYLDGSGGGLVCALTDQSTSAEWGCFGTALTGCEDQSIGAGQANTTAIISGCSTAGIAARVCDAYDDGTYSDWFLPSFNEGKEINNNLAAINNGLTANSGDIFSGVYWTSTQASWDQKGIRPDRKLDAWTFGGGGGEPYDFKNTPHKVRAVRKF